MKIRLVEKNDIEKVAKIHVDVRNLTYDGIIHPDTLCDRTYRRQRDKWMNKLYYNDASNCIMYVAEDDSGSVIGFAAADICTVKEIYGSQLTSIFVLPEYQKQEVGKSLVKTLAKDIYDRGIRNMILWIVEDSPGRGFYERLGGRVAYSRVVFMTEEITEVAYVFDDITSIIN